MTSNLTRVILKRYSQGTQGICREGLNLSVGEGRGSLGWTNLNSRPGFTPRKTRNFIFCIRVNKSQNGHEAIVRWLNEISVNQGAFKHMPEALRERRIHISYSQPKQESSPKRKQFPWRPGLTCSCSDSDSESSLFPLPLPGTLRALLYAA